MTKLRPFDPALLSLPDDQLGLQFYALWAVAQAEKLGISQDQISREIAEVLRLKALTLDTDSEDLAGLEKALQLIAKGRAARGGRMFRQHMERQAMTIAALDEAGTGRRKQRANARKPRPDALQGLILEIMALNSAIKREVLLTELRKREQGEVIYEINDATAQICWHSKAGRIEETPFSGLKDRMSRARKNLRSR